MYDNLLKNSLADNEVTIKGVTQIKVNDKEAISTQDIWDDLKAEKLIAFTEQPNKYTNKGTEYRFCMNDFPDMLTIIDAYLEQAKQGKAECKTFKCSLFLFKLYYADLMPDMPKLEIKVIDTGEDSEASAPILSESAS